MATPLNKGRILIFLFIVFASGGKSIRPAIMKNSPVKRLVNTNAIPDNKKIAQNNQLKMSFLFTIVLLINIVNALYVDNIPYNLKIFNNAESGMHTKNTPNSYHSGCLL